MDDCPRQNTNATANARLPTDHICAKLDLRICSTTGHRPRLPRAWSGHRPRASASLSRSKPVSGQGQVSREQARCRALRDRQKPRPQTTLAPGKLDNCALRVRGESLEGICGHRRGCAFWTRSVARAQCVIMRLFYMIDVVLTLCKPLNAKVLGEHRLFST